MTPQADNTSSNPQAASASSKGAALVRPTVPYKTPKETVQVAMHAKDDGNMSITRYVLPPKRGVRRLA